MMAIERTLSILKPDVIRRNLCGSILVELESAGLIIIAQKRLVLTIAQARAFYEVHHQRPFFDELCQFMISGPIVVQVLEGENAITHYRDVMGATDPSQALPGTIRARFARSITENSVHGSDSPDTASHEIAFFFAQIELLGS